MFHLKTERTYEPRDKSWIIPLHQERQSACLVKKDVILIILFLKMSTGPIMWKKESMCSMGSKGALELMGRSYTQMDFYLILR